MPLFIRIFLAVAIVTVMLLEIARGYCDRRNKILALHPEPPATTSQCINSGMACMSGMAITGGILWENGWWATAIGALGFWFGYRTRKLS